MVELLIEVDKKISSKFMQGMRVVNAKIMKYTIRYSMTIKAV